MNSVCRVCGGNIRSIGDRYVMHKYKVTYAQCLVCDYIQTEEPYWLEEAYHSPITAQDTGSLIRVLHLANVTKVLLALVLDRRGRCLDFGGGYGIFVRRMRDLGVDFWWQDHYCENLLAQGFSANPADAGYELVTCFEVLEHVVAPDELIAALLSRSKAVLVSTELSDGWSERFFDWPYVAAEHGQHVGFFSERTLRAMAQRMGVNFISDGKSLHLFSKVKVPAWKVRMVFRRRVAKALSATMRWESLVWSDHKRMRGQGAESRRTME
jgi:hypothetical protein